MLTLETSIEDAALDLVINKLDDGAAAGYVTICEGATVLATIVFSVTSAAAASGGVKTFNTIDDVTVTTSGTADNCKFYDSDGVYKYTGTIGVADADINIPDGLTLTAGDTLSAAFAQASF